MLKHFQHAIYITVALMVLANLIFLLKPYFKKK